MEALVLGKPLVVGANLFEEIHKTAKYWAWSITSP
jgi:hypothetical protein